MNEGWDGEEYLILFDADERAGVSRRYGVALYLPGYEVAGLVGWDDFLLTDGTGAFFTVPTVPLDPQYLSRRAFTSDPKQLQPDERLRGKVKWYVQPLVFGGDADAPGNLV